jgi:hypothetical protein
MMLGKVHVGGPMTQGALTVFPLWTEHPETAPEYISGARAEQAAVLDVAELDVAQVPHLLVTNHGLSPLLLVEGETLAGGLQTRVLNVSVLVAASAKVTVPVACVEAGRWGGERASRRGATHAPPQLRSRKTASVNASRRYGSRAADQGQVWDSVAAVSHSLSAESATSSYLDAVEQRRADTQMTTEGLRPLPGQRGVLVGIGGEIRGMELFDSAATLADYFDSIVEGYAMEALSEPPVATSASAARQFIRRLAKASWTWSDAVGLGRELALSDAQGLAGTGVGWAEDRPPVHVAAFA